MSSWNSCPYGCRTDASGALEWAAGEAGDLDLVKYLYEKYKYDITTWHIIYAAAENGRDEILQYLLENVKDGYEEIFNTVIPHEDNILYALINNGATDAMLEKALEKAFGTHKEIIENELKKRKENL